MTINSRLILGILFVGSVSATFYREAFLEVISAVIKRESSSHGLFVPAISILFLWCKREKLQNVELKYNFVGLIIMSAGLLPGFFQSATYHVQFLGLLVYTAGVVLILFGANYFKETLFSIAFLTTMIPIPYAAFDMLARGIRYISFNGSVGVISMIGIPFYTEGWNVYLPNAHLIVDISCSGIRYLISYIIFGISYAYLFKSKIGSRFAVIAATIPISILASILRLSTIYFLTYYFGDRMAEHWPHIFTSWTIFFIILVSSILIDQRFVRNFTQKDAKEIHL